MGLWYLEGRGDGVCIGFVFRVVFVKVEGFFGLVVGVGSVVVLGFVELFVVCFGIGVGFVGILEGFFLLVRGRCVVRYYSGYLEVNVKI